VHEWCGQRGKQFYRLSTATVMRKPGAYLSGRVFFSRGMIHGLGGTKQEEADRSAAR